MSGITDFASSAFSMAATGIATTADVGSIAVGGLAATSKTAGTFLKDLGIATNNRELISAGETELVKSEMAVQAERAALITALGQSRDTLNSFGALIKSISEKV